MINILDFFKKEPKTNGNAYVTLLGTNNYTWGVISLAISMERVNTKYPLLVLANDEITELNIHLIEKYTKALIIRIPNDRFNGLQERYRSTLQKFYIFDLTNYDKLCFVDADILFYQNIDFLFDREEEFLFDARWKYSLKENNLCGELFIITPDHNLFKKIINNIQPTDYEDEVVLSRFFKSYTTQDNLIGLVNHYCRYWPKPWIEHNVDSYEDADNMVTKLLTKEWKG